MTNSISKVQTSVTNVNQGTLFVVATPIGNLGDISHRALQVLGESDWILAEDTRHSKRLLNHFGINRKLRSCHEHNEASQIDWAAEQLDQGLSISLISDAGTPLISDPGFVIVRALRERNHQIVAVPGPSSIIAALSIAGLPTDGFVYDGFLPAKSTGRRNALGEYLDQRRTVVLLESSHRIVACLGDIVAILGADREVVLARELTKKFETVLSGPADRVLETLNTDADQTRGEFVVMLAGVSPASQATSDVLPMLRVMLAELPVKQAASLVAKLSGKRKNEIYDLALSLKRESDD